VSALRALFRALTSCFCSCFIVGSARTLFKEERPDVHGGLAASIRTFAGVLRNFNVIRLRDSMIDRLHDLKSPPCAAMALVVLTMSLGGCAEVGDSFASGAFVDPAKYELYDCKQLETERKALAVRTAELQGLIAKAATGTGGTVVGELAYRNDYIFARAQAKLAEETWQRNKCVATTPGAATPVAPPAATPAQAKGRSTSGLY
jgi:hypothetical protein